MSWIKVTDRLPEIGDEILLDFIDSNGKRIVRAAEVVDIKGLYRINVHSDGHDRFFSEKSDRILNWQPILRPLIR